MLRQEKGNKSESTVSDPSNAFYHLKGMGDESLNNRDEYIKSFHSDQALIAQGTLPKAWL